MKEERLTDEESAAVDNLRGRLADLFDSSAMAREHADPWTLLRFVEARAERVPVALECRRHGGPLVRVVGQAVGLAILAHLQRVLDTTQQRVRGIQRLALLSRSVHELSSPAAPSAAKNPRALRPAHEEMGS